MKYLVPNSAKTGGKCVSCGGGNRCKYLSEDGIKCSSGKTDYCTKHGGGKRCVSINIDGTTCENGANSSSDFCKKHGAFPMCKECNSYSAKRGEDLCGYCNPAKHVKRKELRIKKYLEEKELLFFHDKVVKLSNNKVAKPDFLFVDNTIEHRVILEVDEY